MNSAIHKIISNQEETKNVRNICILAHIDHGKTTLADQLISSNRIISTHLAGKVRYMDSREDEQDKGITMKSSAISLLHPYIQRDPQNGPPSLDEYSINLIDSPGHVDFSMEVSSAARLTDGAIVVVDAVEGVSTQTRSVLYQAYKENIELTLVVNKIDKLMHLKSDPMECFMQIERIISQTNVLMSNYYTKDMVDQGKEIEDIDSENFFQPSKKGNVVFSCAYDGWGFRVHDFARIFSKVFGMKEEILTQTLWGRFYYNAKKKAIKTKPNKENQPPMFVTFILKNIYDVYNVVIENEIEKLKKMVIALKLEISPKLVARKTEDEKSSYEKFALIMREWLPLERSVLDTVVECLPSPLDAQRNRILQLIPELHELQEKENEEKDTTQTTAVAPSTSEDEHAKKFLVEMRNYRRELKRQLLKCDHSDDTHTLAFISKMLAVDYLPSVFEAKERFKKNQTEENGDDAEDESVQEKDHLIGFARVFSGKLRVGQEIHVLGPRYNPHKPDQYRDVTTITSLYLMMGKDLIPVQEVPAGNLCGVGGLEKLVLKTATLSSSAFAPIFSAMYFQAHPIIKIAIEPQNVLDTPKLAEGLQLLNRADPSVLVFTQHTGEHVIMTAGEVHAERCIRDLKEKFAQIPLVVSPPLVSFRETIVEDENNPTKDRVAYTANRQCKITVRAISVPQNISTFISNNEVALEKAVAEDFDLDIAERQGLPVLHKLKEEFEKAGPKWAKEWDNLWSLGPRFFGPNLFLNHIPNYENAHFRSISERMIHPSARVNTQNIQDESVKKLIHLDGGFVGGFQLATKEGPLCAEPMFGVCFAIKNVEFLDMDTEITSGQVISAVAQACKRAFNSSARRLVEAKYYCELVVSQEYIGPACTVLKQRRANILEQDIEEGTGQFIIKCHLPIVESFGFSDELRNATSGECTPNIVFSHWEILDVDPYKKMITMDELEEFGDVEDKDNIALQYINNIRKRKGLMVEELLVDEGEKNRNLSKKK
mmetsp:Transcript_9142/g.33754  ORF Transcript_9142/g.33754 Transcript_9142/m.33754 type:complete len:996 (-) Transcript_9142:108-3095(-)